ncbi:MAG: hypothetical protein RJP95_01335, partial [Pirellulales bacterium]
MWARVVEFMLGCWLAISPFVFGHGEDPMLWIADLTAAFAVMVLALLWYWTPTRHAHFGIAVVAVAMIGYGRFAGGAEVAPALQNHIGIGLLLLMFAIVPNHASSPPRVWYQNLKG